MPAYIVPEAKGLQPGQKVIATVQGRELGIFNVAGRLHAVRNVCADQSGPLCQGDIERVGVAPERIGVEVEVAALAGLDDVWTESTTKDVERLAQ